MGFCSSGPLQAGSSVRSWHLKASLVLPFFTSRSTLNNCPLNDRLFDPHQKSPALAFILRTPFKLRSWTLPLGMFHQSKYTLLKNNPPCPLSGGGCPILCTKLLSMVPGSRRVFKASGCPVQLGPREDPCPAPSASLPSSELPCLWAPNWPSEGHPRPWEEVQPGSPQMPLHGLEFSDLQAGRQPKHTPTPCTPTPQTCGNCQRMHALGDAHPASGLRARGPVHLARLAASLWRVQWGLGSSKEAERKLWSDPHQLPQVGVQFGGPSLGPLQASGPPVGLARRSQSWPGCSSPPPSCEG